MKSLLKLFFVIVLIPITFILSSCSYNPYIGTRVNYSGPYFCQCIELPSSCAIGQKEDMFIFDFIVTKGFTSNEYTIKGVVKCTGQGGFATLDKRGTQFVLHLVADGLIINSLWLNPLGNDLDHDMPFKEEFKSKPFDAVVVSWKALVRG